jgi:hypothetical protein
VSNALRAELHRVLSRRLYRLVGLLLFGLILTISITIFVQSHDDPGHARREAARAVEDCRRSQAEVPDEHFDCPTVDELQREFDRTFRYAQSVPETIRGFAGFLIAIAFMVGASAVAAEWSSGTMTTTLTWEPDRRRVLVAKVAAPTLVVVASVFVVLGLFSVLLIPAAAFRGSTDGMGWSFWWSLIGLWGRGAVLAGWAAAAGAAIAFVTRNTAGALGGAFVFMAIISPLLGAWRQGKLLPWLLQRNIPQILGAPVTGDGPNPPLIASTSLVRPSLVLLLYAAVLIGAGYVSFSSRDVT